ncbi:polysaccharide biosynthesis protein [Rhodobacteraceae bacterium CYK-10]|uniref:Polysaccharide biosynthesis protein n=1 Tax=Stagnihabitans tardus TaxID=2699202 RepID=A0AAE4Y7Y4_9RHOB|nr:nucleoside-diphosphate sugar epimerase/dehydratase [Stagnihabitans tardus]NBZ86852.1 polysaccharide biosynthesis protein [Stagnihabitans tardus]
MRSRLFGLVERLSRTHKRLVFLSIDILIVECALLATLMLEASSLWPGEELAQIGAVFLFLPPVAAALSTALGIPNIRLKAYESLSYTQTANFSALLVVALWAMFGLKNFHFTLIGYALFGLTFFIGSVGVRLAMLNAYLLVLRWGQRRWRVAIYGAGTTGVQLAAALKNHESIVVVAFIDDDEGQQSMTIAGLKVHSPDKIERLVREKEVDRVLLAMPSASAPRQMQIAHRLQSLGLDVLALPSFAQLVGTEALIDNLAPVVPDAFLGRQSVDDQITTGSTVYPGKSVMVTGAGGSIGSELCRQLLALKPRKLVLFEVSEKALYDIDRELRELPDFAGVELVPLLGSITDSRATRTAMADHGIEVVIHAAAYKHVPLVESNPVAGMSNNVLGTRILADAAEESGVERFILISTDKAVRPTNVMGASKRMAEMVVQDLAKRATRTSFAIVRFGNVLGSSGSVVPLFKEQIRKGGPITLTHEDVTRYFMTISEAVQLVLLAGSFPVGGAEADVFVLDMGKPMRIRDLAEQMILAAGYRVRDEANPDGDIEIRMIGLRPGEKLHEELLIGAGLLTTPHAKILRARERSLTELDMAKALQSLRHATATGDAQAARAVAAAYVEGFGGIAEGQSPVFADRLP